MSNKEQLIAYAKSGTILKENGYELTPIHTHLRDGFKITGHGISHEIDCGIFNAIFLNQWISRSGILGITPYCIGFDNPYDNQSIQGKLSSFANIPVNEESKIRRDLEAVKYFFSEEIVGNEDNKSAYILTSLEPSPALDFIDIDESGIPHVDIGEIAKVPFYIAINLVGKNRRTFEEVPHIWSVYIRENRYSWNYSNGILYISNTIGSKYGLPPNSSHLGFKKLELKVEDWSMSRPKAKNSLSFHNSVAENNWEVLVSQFFDSPSQKTFRVVGSSAICKKQYLTFSKDPQYKMGSNKFKATGPLRSRFLGEANAADFSELASEIASMAQTSNARRLILVFKIYGLVITNSEGRFYFSEQN